MRWTAGARMGFMVAGAALALAFSGSLAEALSLLTIVALTAALQLAVLAELRREAPRLSLTGWAQVGIDAAVIVGLPVMWHLVYTTADEPLLHLTRHNFTAICTVFMAMHVPALRAIWPAVVSAVAVATHVVLALISIMDPRLDDFPGGFSRAVGVGTGGTDMLVVTPALLLLAGVFLTLGTRSARRTVLEVVALEQRERELRERQLEAVLDARLAAVAELVAGVEHELNSPLGAVRGATDTGTRAAARLRTLLAASEGTAPRELERVLSALDQALRLAHTGTARVTEVMGRVKGFVRLDRSDVQLIDLAELVREVVDVVQVGVNKEVRVIAELSTGLQLQADPRRLSQAFSTVVRNACEAYDGRGEVTVTLTPDGDSAKLEVVDRGRGMESAQLERLFSVDFVGGARVRARFGLPLCRSILRRHGGDITIRSRPGEGTTATLRLPCAPLASAKSPHAEALEPRHPPGEPKAL